MASLGGRLVLAGGRDLENPDQADTCAWNGTMWNSLDIPGPPATFGAAIAPLGGSLVLFGGVDSIGTQCLSGTWRFDGTAWTELPIKGPAARVGALMAPLHGTLILFGGDGDCSNRTGTPQAMLSDTWSFDGTAWTELHVTGPAPRISAAMAPLRGAVVLFGGDDFGASGNDLSDTWTFDSTAWTKLDIPGPPRRWDAAMAPLDESVVLFGGIGGAGGNFLADTWTFDGNEWTERRIPGPSARASAAMATP